MQTKVERRDNDLSTADRDQESKQEASTASAAFDDLRPQALAQRQHSELANTGPRRDQQRMAAGAIQRKTDGAAAPNRAGLPDRLKAGIESLSGISMDGVKVHYNSSQPARLNSHASAQDTGIHIAPGPVPNSTGLPDRLKDGIEYLSRMSMDHVHVHYNSAQPAQMNAHAYAQGSNIYIGPGQQQHLPHEAWHVVQQAQGRVRPTVQTKAGVALNDDGKLEHEADVMGARAAALDAGIGGKMPLMPVLPAGDTLQARWRSDGTPAEAVQQQLEILKEDFDGSEALFYWDLQSILVYYPPAVGLFRSGSLYAMNDAEHWSSLELQADDEASGAAHDAHLRDIHEEATGVEPSKTRLGQMLIASGVAVQHVNNLLNQEREAQLRTMIEALPDEEPLRRAVLWVLGGENRMISELLNVLVTKNRYNYSPDMIYGWIAAHDVKTVGQALDLTATEDSPQWVSLCLRYHVRSDSTIEYQQLIRVKANIASGANTMAVTKPDKLYAGGGSHARTGFLNFTFVDGTTCDIHTHWYKTDRKITSAHIQVAGANGAEINTWSRIMDNVMAAIVIAHNTAAGNLVPTGGALHY